MSTSPARAATESLVRSDSPWVTSLALVAVCLGYFMVILDTGIVNVALPALRTDLRASVSGLQWVVDGYLLMLAALLLSGGVIADRVGARRIFQGRLGLFAAASRRAGSRRTSSYWWPPGWCRAWARRPRSPPRWRCCPRPIPTKPRGPARSECGVALPGVAAAAGRSLGGVLVTASSWRRVFAVNVPIGVAAMALTARQVPAPAPRPRALDPIAQLSGVRFGRTDPGVDRGWAPRPHPAGGAAGEVFLAAAAAFVAVERRASAPIAGLASGVINAARQVGGLIGVAHLGAVVGGSGASLPDCTSRSPSRGRHSWPARSSPHSRSAILGAEAA